MVMGGQYASDGYYEREPARDPRVGGSVYDPPPGAPPTARAARGPPNYQAPPPGFYGPYNRERPHLIPAKVGAVLAMIGVFIFFCGLIIIVGVGVMDSHKYLDEVITLGWMLSWVGLMIITFPLFVVGMADGNLTGGLRGGMVAGGCGIIIGAMVVSLFLSLILT